MKILSVYQANTKDAEGNLPECDYVSHGCRQDDVKLFEAAPDLLLACERLLYNFQSLLAQRPVRDVTETIAEAHAAIAKARGETV